MPVFRRAALALAAVLLAVPAVSQTQAQAQTQAQSRDVLPLDRDWRFTKGDQKGAEQPAFDASAWTSLSIPHDWSIAGPFDKNNPTGQGGAYLPNGIGWYRKDLQLPAPDAHRHVFVVFDGVMANSDVWINGFHLGKRPYGYVSFLYDLTGHLDFTPGAHNILAVRCDNSLQPASRWYEGAGIYRHARLVVTGDVHIEPWGVVLTTPVATAAKATVHISTTVDNESSADASTGLLVTLTGPDGRVAARGSFPVQSIPQGKSAVFSGDLPVSNPALWNLDKPALYKATVEVKSSKNTVDQDQEQFGIREFHFDPDKGFFLNGQNFKIKGAALHIDGGAVGIAVPDAVYEQRLLALKALGVNAIRTAHNPPSPNFLDLCDRLGLLVMDEFFDAWTIGKNPYDYHLFFREWALKDERDTIRRDRNHPSIILYSVGNEIHDTPHPEIALPILKSLVATAHEADPTRPVTQALFRPNASHDYDNGLADMLDVVGQNYRENELLAAHAAKPTRKIIGTENTHDRPVWLAMRDHPEYSGQFLWTGADYLGEAGEAGGWPIFGNGAGLLDRTDFPRARGLERQSWWAAAPNVHAVRRVAPQAAITTDPGYSAAPARFRQVLFHDWNPAAAAPGVAPGEENVEVYTNCDEVDLLLNGTSLGRQKLHPDASPLTWKVPYAPGTLKAVAYNAGKPVAEDTLRTAGTPAKLALNPVRSTVSPSLDDLLAVEVLLEDTDGAVVPTTGTDIRFSVTGPGVVVAVDNGSNTDHDSFQASARKTYEGRAVVYLRATSGSGAIHLTASASGLTDATATLQATSPRPAPFIRSF